MLGKAAGKVQTHSRVSIQNRPFFSRIGFLQEILTDQGTDFMSKLLDKCILDVYCLLGIKGLRTTPHHPQTDGLTEQFNETLKQMLSKFVNETGSVLGPVAALCLV